MPVILTIQEADIKRIVVQGQPDANSSWRPYLKKPNPEQQAWQVVEWLKW
jgi:hypothetical protein